MRINAAPLVVLAGLLLPVAASADEQLVSFAARWPETAMRKPSMTEMVHLMTVTNKGDLTSAVKSELVTRRLKPVRCTIQSCDVLGSR